MTDFTELYRQRLMSPEQALKQIPNNALIATSCDALEPITMLQNMHKLHDKIDQVTIHIGACTDNYPFLADPRYRDKFKVTSRFFSQGMRSNFGYGNISLIPIHFHSCINRYNEVWKPDVIITSGTKMDKHGYINLSLGGWEKQYLDTAKAVIVEIVDDMPNVPGEFELHISDITAVVESGRNTPTSESSIIGSTEAAIGAYVGELVEDGSTIQLGIGRIPDAIAQAFYSKRDLGVHTELLTNSIADLAERGVITNRKKSMFKGKTVSAFCMGSRKLYDYIDCNPSVYMMPITYVNDPYIIAQQEQMVAINTCLEVDLTGQIASESIGTRQYSGTGGQNDFMEGAIHSHNGKSIMALPSSGVSRDGIRFTKIKPTLTPGAVVTTSRNNVDYIVTEFGIAYIKCQTVRQRVDNLIAVAHPDFRDELRREAQRLNIR